MTLVPGIIVIEQDLAARYSFKLYLAMFFTYWTGILPFRIIMPENIIRLTVRYITGRISSYSAKPLRELF